MGRVHGMQLSEVPIKELVFCVHDASRQEINAYQYIHLLPRQVKKLSLLTCDMKQVDSVAKIAKCIKVVLWAVVDPNTELKEYLRQSVNI